MRAAHPIAWLQLTVCVLIGLIFSGGYSPELEHAVRGWENGTAVIRSTWWDYATHYRERLAKFLNVSTEALVKQIAADPAAATAAKDELFEDYENNVHLLLKKEIPTADPLVINPILRANLGTLRVTLPSDANASKSLKEVLDDGLPLTKRYFDALFEAAKNGRNPATDTAAKDLYDKYLGRRQAVTEALARSTPMDPVPALARGADFWTAVVFAAFLILFFVYLVIRKDDYPESRRSLVAFLAALAAGFAAILIIGTAIFEWKQQLTHGSLIISGSAGFALFMIVFFFFDRRRINADPP